MTSERLAIADIVAYREERFTVEQLNEELEHVNFHVSLATVYNTVNLLVEAGIVRLWATDATGTGVYERAERVPPRVKLVCSDCGSIKEVRDDELASLLVRRRYGKFGIAHFDLRAVGLCLKCQRRRKREAASKS